LRLLNGEEPITRTLAALTGGKTMNRNVPLLLLIMLLVIGCGAAEPNTGSEADTIAEPDAPQVESTLTVMQPEAQPTQTSEPTSTTPTEVSEATSVPNATIVLEGSDLNVPSLAKVDPNLAAVFQEYQTYTQAGGTEPFTTSNPLVTIVEGRVVIEATAASDVEVLRADLEALGLQNTAVAAPLISGQLPIEALDDLGALDSLQFARSPAGTTN
jgi:hypothetical protein